MPTLAGFGLFVSNLNVPVIFFSLLRTFTSLPGLNEQGIKCLAQGNNTVPLVSLEPETLRSHGMKKRFITSGPGHEDINFF